MSSFWPRQLNRLADFLENDPVQYDLYLDDEHIGGISVIGEAKNVWWVGHKFSYPWKGSKPEFVLERLTPEGGRVRADLFILEGL